MNELIYFLTETLPYWYVITCIGAWVLIVVSLLGSFGCEAHNIKCNWINKPVDLIFDNPKRLFWTLMTTVLAAIIAVVKAM